MTITPEEFRQGRDEARILAQMLRDGALADIWYDTATFGDPDGTYGPLIEQTQHAMNVAAGILDHFADLADANPLPTEVTS